MAQEVLHISVTDDGSARVVARNLESLGKSGDRASSSVDFLKKALVGIGAAAVIRQIVQMNDEFTKLTNTLKTNAGPGGLGQVNSQLAALSEIAARTRSGLSSTVETFDTLVDATERLGVSNERLLPITETALKLFRIGGQDAGAAASSVRALGAALASNDFSRGINSLLRQNLDFANAVAKGFGTSAEELRNWAKDGKVTAESFLAALESIKTETDATFGLTQSTISEATGQVGDALTLLIGRFFDTTNTGKTVTTTITDVATSIRNLANDSGRMESAGSAFLRFLEDVIQRARVVIRVLQEVGTTILTIGQAGGSLGQLLNPAALVQNLAAGKNPLDLLSEGFGPLKEQIANLPQFVNELNQLATAPIFSRPGGAAAAPTGGGAAAGAGGTGVDPRSLLAPGRSATADAEKAIKEQERLMEAYARLRGELDPLVAAQQKYTEQMRIIEQVSKTGTVSADELAAAQHGVAAELEKARTEASRAAVEDFQKLQEQMDPLIAAGRQYAETLRVINEAAKTGAISQGEIAAAVKQATTVYDEARDKANGLGGSLMDGVVASFDNALNSLVNFTQTGQLNIREFASSVVSDLQKIVVKMFLVRALTSLAGAAGGGGTGFGSFLTAVASGIGGARAEGGPVVPGRAFIVGERGPELFVPPTRGNIVPNHALGGIGGAPTIVNVFDPAQIPGALTTREGEQAILNVIQANRGRLREVLV